MVEEDRMVEGEADAEVDHVVEEVEAALGFVVDQPEDGRKRALFSMKHT